MARASTEPVIRTDDILMLPDPAFSPQNVCIVTGASSGVGRALCVVAAANKITVVGLDVDEKGGEQTQKLAREMGGQMIFMKADLTRDEDLDHAVYEAAKLGAIRYLANNADVQHNASIEKFPMSKYDFMQRLMLRAPYYLSKLCIPHMKKCADGRGAIGNMASVNAHISTPNTSVHSITTFGLRGLAQSISAEGRGRIRSFTVSVGGVKTASALKQISTQAESRDFNEKKVVSNVMLGHSRVKRLMAPVEVANLFLFGFSRFGQFLVGGDMLFDGGAVKTY